MAVREGQFSPPSDAPPAEITVSDTLNHVAAVFRENWHDNPKQDAECNVAWLLRHQLRLYKKDNPKEVQQKALPSFASSFPQNPQNFAKQWVNSQEPPTNGRCAHASMQKFQKQSKGKQSNCASGISHSSETAKPLTTALSLFIWKTVFRLRLNDRKMTERPTPAFSGGHRMSFCAPSRSGHR